jgi:hypothetical protein
MKSIARSQPVIFIRFSSAMNEKPTNQSSLTEDGKTENVFSQQTPQDDHPASSLPKEDLVAWLQVLGAFCLNLNTWYFLILELPFSID